MLIWFNLKGLKAEFKFFSMTGLCQNRVVQQLRGPSCPNAYDWPRTYCIDVMHVVHTNRTYVIHIAVQPAVENILRASVNLAV